MKLLNKSLVYLSVWLFVIVSLWSLVFYFNMLSEIKSSVDEGLENYKRQIIYHAQEDSSILLQSNFDEGFYSIKEISKDKALTHTDRYIDTIMYMQDADDYYPELEPVRLFSTAFELNQHYYELHIANSMIEEDDLVKTLLLDAIWLYFVLILSVIIINNYVLKKLWNPFYSFLSQLRSYKIGTSKKMPEVKTETKEFTDLQNAVNILLHRNLETYEHQKQFIGNASHELQTPLAIAINKMELLIEKGNLQSEQAENVAEVMQIIERLVRLNKSLLLLTKIENKQFLDNQQVSINEVVKQNINDLEEFSEYKNVKIIFLETTRLTVQMDVSLANIIVSNLLRNAIFHNVENGNVTIEISENTLEIRNTGIKAPINEQQLFTRFHKSKQNENGTGLGLAIVKAICDLYHFSISYRFENNFHLFELQLQHEFDQKL